MSHCSARIRRFRFNFPQRIAAGLLACFLLQGVWLIAHTPLAGSEYDYARCGRESWEGAPATGGCEPIRDGLLAYRIAGLPLTLDLLAERALDRFRAPENRVVQGDSAPLSAWELRHQLPLTPYLLRLPFLAAGFLLGGALWWVTRRLYGNFGGYTALALYCFCPPILQASTEANPEILAALGVFASVYASIGVANAMQGPRRKWRPRIVLLTLCFALVAATHLAALALNLLLGLIFMLWVSVGRRKPIFPVLLLALSGAFFLTFFCHGFSANSLAATFQLSQFHLGFSAVYARRFFLAWPTLGISMATAAALALYAAWPRSRYFGNTTPLLCAAFLFVLLTAGAPWLWALPFLLTFLAGVFSDAHEGAHPRFAFAAAAALAALQALGSLALLSGG